MDRLAVLAAAGPKQRLALLDELIPDIEAALRFRLG
jgi:hypothetical protein